MRLIQTTNRNFISALWAISYQAKSIGEQFHSVRQLYEIHEIRNKVPDGTISFPEDSRSLASGITVEFQYVLRPPRLPASRIVEVFPAPSCTQKRLLSLSQLGRFRPPRCVVQNRKGSALRQSGALGFGLRCIPDSRALGYRWD